MRRVSADVNGHLIRLAFQKQLPVIVYRAVHDLAGPAHETLLREAAPWFLEIVCFHVFLKKARGEGPIRAGALLPPLVEQVPWHIRK